MKSSLIKIIAAVAALHIIIIGLFCSTPMFCSDISRLTSLSFPMTTIRQMNQLNVSTLTVANIIRQGNKLTLDRPTRSLYMCNVSGIGIAVDEITEQVVAVMKEPQAYEMLTKIDADIMRKRAKNSI